MKAAPYQLDNEFKIKFRNAMSALLEHFYHCPACLEYFENGQGDMCAEGKDIIAYEFLTLKEAAVLPKEA